MRALDDVGDIAGLERRGLQGAGVAQLAALVVHLERHDALALLVAGDEPDRAPPTPCACRDQLEVPGDQASGRLVLHGGEAAVVADGKHTDKPWVRAPNPDVQELAVRVNVNVGVASVVVADAGDASRQRVDSMRDSQSSGHAVEGRDGDGAVEFVRPAGWQRTTLLC